MKKSSAFIALLTVFIDFLGFGIILPLLPYYAREFHATSGQIGIIFAMYSFTQLIFSPVWGGISDKIGRRPIIMLSVLGSCIANLWTGFAGSLWILFAARGLAGIMAANVSTTQAYIADMTEPEERAKYMGLVGASIGMGFVIGPAIGGLITGFFNIHYAFFFAAGLALLDLFLAYFLLPESLKVSTHPTKGFRHFDTNTISHAWENSQLRILIFLYFIITFSFSILETTLPIFGKDKFQMDAAHMGYFFGFIGLISAFVQGGLVGRMAKKYGEQFLVVSGAFLLIFGLGLIPIPNVLSGLVIVGVISAIATGLTNPSIISLISRIADPSEQGGYRESPNLCPVWGVFSDRSLGEYSINISAKVRLIFPAVGLCSSLS